MQQIRLTLDPKTVNTARSLADRYGNSASVSAVVRLAVKLLDDRWAQLEKTGAPQGAERSKILNHLCTARRGNAAATQ